MNSERTKKRLQKKLKMKKSPSGDQTGGSSSNDQPDDFMAIMNEVNKMFKTNPEMIKKVSKCVNNIMDNKELMQTLVSKVTDDIENEQNEQIGQIDQTLLNKDFVEQLEALSNEDKQ